MKTTNKIKALIIDDEKRAINVLSLLIQNHVPCIDLVLTANSAKEGLQLLQESNFDLVFLDIQMPYMNGFELLQAIPNPSFDVIFTTAFNQYAIQAIRVSAIDYLLKPIQIEELKLAIERFQKQKKEKKERQKLFQNFAHNLEHQADTQSHRLAIPSQEGTIFLPIPKILRCEASSNYTYFFMENGKRHITSKTLKEYEESLQHHHFLRVHKSHLVNMNHVKECIGNQLTLSDKSKVEISRRKKAHVLNQLKGK